MVVSGFPQSQAHSEQCLNLNCLHDMKLRDNRQCLHQSTAYSGQLDLLSDNTTFLRGNFIKTVPAFILQSNVYILYIGLQRQLLLLCAIDFQIQSIKIIKTQTFFPLTHLGTYYILKAIYVSIAEHTSQCTAELQKIMPTISFSYTNLIQ